MAEWDVVGTSPAPAATGGEWTVVGQTPARAPGSANAPLPSMFGAAGGAVPGAYVPQAKPTPTEREQEKTMAAGTVMGLAGPALAVGEVIAPETTAGIEKAYQAQRQRSGDTGFDPYRMVGGAPYAALLPEMKAGSAIGRVAKLAGAAGGLEGVTQPVGRTDTSQPLLPAKAGQMAGAALTAGALGGLGEIGAQAASRTAGNVASKTEQYEQTAKNWAASHGPVSYTHLTLPTNREV